MKNVAKNNEYVTQGEMQASLGFIAKDMELVVQNSMEQVYTRLKQRVDEKAGTEDMEKVLRMKVNTTDMNRRMEIMDEKLVDGSMWAVQRVEDAERVWHDRWCKVEERLGEVEKQLAEKVGKEWAELVGERVSRLEQLEGDEEFEDEVDSFEEFKGRGSTIQEEENEEKGEGENSPDHTMPRLSMNINVTVDSLAI